MHGSNPGTAGSTSGFTGAIFAKVVTGAGTTAQGGVQVFTSSVSTQHSVTTEIIYNHKVSSITSDIKVSSTAAGNISSSGSHTYSAYASGALVATDEYLMYGVVLGRNNGSNKYPTSVSSNWANRESYASGTGTSDTFVSTQSRQFTGATALTINSHAATSAVGYWASATIAIPGAVSSTVPSGTVASAYNYDSVVAGQTPVGVKQGTVATAYNYDSGVVGRIDRKGTIASGYDYSAVVTGQTPSSLPAAVIPTQAQMPANPFDLYPAPALAWGSGAAPSGVGYTNVGPTHSLVQLIGHAAKGVQAGSISGFVNPAPLQDIAGAGTGTNPLVYPPYAPVVYLDHKEVWFRLGQRSYSGFSNVSARAAVRIRINNKWISLMPVYLGSTIGFPTNPENITAGEYWLKLTFPTNELRRIEVFTHLEFGGVAVLDSSGSVAQVPASPGSTIALLDGSLGGSEKHQTGNFALNSANDGSGAGATYTAVTSYIGAVAQILGYGSIINSGAGSSGFSINGDTASWKSTGKITKDIIEHQPDTIIVGSANNDMASGQSVSQVDIASNTVYGAIASAAKVGALKFALGMLTPPAMGSQSSGESAVAPYNAVLKARAQQHGFWFINPATGQTFDPQGNLVKTTSNWVYQNLSDISSDNTHPTQVGANNLGAKVAAAILMAHPVGVSDDVSQYFAGKDLDSHGPSWVQYGPDGQPPFPDLLPAVLGFTKNINHGLSARRDQDNAQVMVDTTDNTYFWDTASTAVGLIHGGNNLLEADTPANRSAAYESWRVMAALMSASSRIEQSAWTFRPNANGDNWVTDSAQPYASGGTATIGFHHGLQVDIPVPAGTSYLLCHGTDINYARGATLHITQNGVEIATKSLDNVTVVTPNEANNGVSPIVIRLPNLQAGTVTVTVDHAGLTGQVVAIIDALLPMSTSPRMILGIKPVTLIAPSHDKPALFAFLRTIPDLIRIEFGTHFLSIDPMPTWNPSTMLGPDGLHPNVAGTMQHRDAIVAAIKVVKLGGNTAPYRIALLTERGSSTWPQKYKGSMPRKSKYRGSDVRILTW